MIRGIFEKFFGNAKNPKAPKSFKLTNRSIFMNRYAGLVYFLIGWHLFGYVIMSTAKNRAEKQGL